MSIFRQLEMQIHLRTSGLLWPQETKHSVILTDPELDGFIPSGVFSGFVFPETYWHTQQGEIEKTCRGLLVRVKGTQTGEIRIKKCLSRSW